jgi:hypothetical protein
LLQLLVASSVAMIRSPTSHTTLPVNDSPSKRKTDNAKTKYDRWYSVPAASRLTPPPIELNRVWIADIAYIPLKENAFAYLALTLDAIAMRKRKNGEFIP